jgi:hypothetical protein
MIYFECAHDALVRVQSNPSDHRITNHLALQTMSCAPKAIPVADSPLTPDCRVRYDLAWMAVGIDSSRSPVMRYLAASLRLILSPGLIGPAGSVS